MNLYWHKSRISKFFKRIAKRNWKTNFHYLPISPKWNSLFIRRDKKPIFIIYRFCQIEALPFFYFYWHRTVSCTRSWQLLLAIAVVHIVRHRFSFLFPFSEIEELIFAILRFHQIWNHYLFVETWNVIYKIINELFNCYLPKLKNLFSLFTDFAKLEFFIYSPRLKM